MENLAYFNKIIVSLIEIMKSLTTIEQEKLNAITKKNLEKLDDCIKNEQVLVMKLKGIEKKREKFLNSSGCEGLSFKQIISSLTGDEKTEAQRLFDTLSTVTADFNSINSSVKTTIEVNLHSIDMVLDELKSASNKNNASTSLNSGIDGRLV